MSGTPMPIKAAANVDLPYPESPRIPIAPPGAASTVECSGSRPFLSSTNEST